MDDKLFQLIYNNNRIIRLLKYKEIQVLLNKKENYKKNNSSISEDSNLSSNFQ